MRTLDVFESVRLLDLNGVAFSWFSINASVGPSALWITLLHCAICSFLTRISSWSRFSYPESSRPLVMNVLLSGGLSRSILSIWIPPLYFNDLWFKLRFKNCCMLLWWASVFACSRFLVAFRHLVDHSLNNFSAKLLSLLNYGFRFSADVESRVSFWEIDLYSLTLIFTLCSKIMFNWVLIICPPIIWIGVPI